MTWPTLNPSIDDVLQALIDSPAWGRSARSYTAYIANKVRDREDFRLTRTDYVKARLQQARDAGFVERSSHATGHYGYSWWLTEKGRAHLAKSVRAA